MAEQFLDHSEVGSAFQQVGCERVAEQVRVGGLLDASKFRPFLDDLADACGGEGTAADADEQVRRGFASDEAGALVGEVVGNGFERLVADADDAGFPALAGDAHEAALEVHHLQARLAKLGKPEAGGVEELKNRKVTTAERLGGIDGIEQHFQVRSVEGLRQGGLGTRGEEGLGRVHFQFFPGGKPAEKDFEMDGGDAERGGAESLAFPLGEEGGKFVGADVAEADFGGVHPVAQGVEALADRELVSV